MKNNILSVFLLLFAATTYAQKLTPLEVVKNVFTDYCFMAEIPKHSAGSYDGIPNVSTINRAYELRFKVLEQDAKTAVVNMTVDSMGQGKDTYVYLEKKDVWKIIAFTELPRHPLEYEERKILEAKELQEKVLTNEDLEETRAYMQFTFALDDEIVAYFKTHEVQFKRIAAELEQQQLLEKETLKGKNLQGYISTDFSNLFLLSISLSKLYEGSYDFFIGGMAYSHMGYLYIPNPKNVPRMDSSSLILLREIGEGWYLYKRF